MEQEQSENNTTNSNIQIEIFEFVKKCGKNLHLLMGIETPPESLIQLTDYFVANEPDILSRQEIILKAMPFGNFAFKRQMTVDDFSVTTAKLDKIKNLGKRYYTSEQVKKITQDYGAKRKQELENQIETLKKDIRSLKLRWSTQPEAETGLGWKEFMELQHELMDKNGKLEDYIGLLENRLKQSDKFIKNIRNKFLETKNEPEKLIKILSKLLE